jgi:hypothetical protein
MSNLSDGPPSRFASLLTTITPRSLVVLAVRIRYPNVYDEGAVQQRCGIIQPPKYGAFNLLYTVEFADGAKWLVRIPCPEENGRFTDASSRSIRSAACTMIYLRRKTSIPIPEIHGSDETINNEVGAPYIMMEFVDGYSVDELWFDDRGPTPLPLRRIRILKTLAEAMSELRKFQFDKIGALQFDSDNILDPRCIVEFDVPDESADLRDMESGVDNGPNFRKIGPFDSSCAYFEALLAMQRPPRDPCSIGLHHLLKMVIRCLPPSIAEQEPCPESFVFAHPDLDCQNVLVSEDGTLVALIDWDNVHTVPRCIGYSRYPSWITRDWDPMKYGYQVPGCRPENSPEELEYFRKTYAAHMSALLPESFDYSTKSHLFEAVWIAASSPICLDSIVQKIFKHLDLKDDDGDSLHLYDTAVDLAAGELEADVASGLVKSFQDLFSVDPYQIRQAPQYIDDAFMFMTIAENKEPRGREVHYRRKSVNNVILTRIFLSNPSIYWRLNFL